MIQGKYVLQLEDLVLIMEQHPVATTRGRAALLVLKNHFDSEKYEEIIKLAENNTFPQGIGRTIKRKAREAATKALELKIMYGTFKELTEIERDTTFSEEVRKKARGNLIVAAERWLEDYVTTELSLYLSCGSITQTASFREFRKYDKILNDKDFPAEVKQRINHYRNRAVRTSIEWRVKEGRYRDLVLISHQAMYHSSVRKQARSKIANAATNALKECLKYQMDFRSSELVSFLVYEEIPDINRIELGTRIIKHAVEHGEYNFLKNYIICNDNIPEQVLVYARESLEQAAVNLVKISKRWDEDPEGIHNFHRSLNKPPYERLRELTTIADFPTTAKTMAVEYLQEGIKELAILLERAEEDSRRIAQDKAKKRHR